MIGATQKMAQTAPEQLDQLLIGIVHDARSLLRKSLISSELISRTGTPLEPGTQKLLDSIIAANRDLEKFLGRISDYANARHPSPARPVPLTAVVEAALATFREHGAVIEPGVVPAVKVSPSLQRAISELLDNALKFHGAKEPTARVECSVQGNECTIEIRDGGIGIDPQYLDTVLEPLVRLQSRDEYPGFGMGLAISRRIVESLGGRLSLESEPSNGSVARLTLPCKE